MSNKVKIGCLTKECYVSGSILKNIINAFSDGRCIIEIAGLSNDDCILNDIRSVIRKADLNSVIFTYEDMVESFFRDIEVSNSEVVILYFLDGNEILTDYFENSSLSNSPQSSAISSGICQVVCTWVTGENALWFHYNREKYDKKTLLKKMNVILEC
ncbi:hypothetical protein [uncultured Ruminococcus sp.]|uniref:hypothetical protein n=1 Tax=uncultured Ruminococcus sp. TaxID=165186 RepID=UPI0026248777|nr:hypothetical protein [uncultured Ruminococcus sp.]